MLLMGMKQIRQRELAKTATRQAMDVIQAKTVNAEKANTLGVAKFSVGRDVRFGSAKEAAVLA